MKKTIDIRPSDLETLRAVLADFLPQTAGCFVFGSRTRGSARPWSDIDLLIKDQQALSLTTYYGLQDALEESDLSIKADVVDWYRISPEFRETIESDLIPLR